MAQGYDPAEPGSGDALQSAPVRTNFAAIWSTSEGVAAPTGAVLGTMWVDSVAPGNVKLKIHDGTSFITLIEHLEDTTQIQFQGSQLGFTFVQGAPATPWNVNHALNRFPSVTVTDAANLVIIPASITYVDANNITITFGGAQAGNAYLN